VADRQRRLEAELGNLQTALEWTLSTGEVELALRLGTALIGTWWGLATMLRSWYQRAQEWARTSADTLPLNSKAQLFRHLGRYAFWHAEYATAGTYIEQALALFQGLGDGPGIAKTMEYLADVARDTGNFARAEQQYGECLARYEQLGDAAEVALIYHAYGESALLQEAYDRAYFHAEESLRRFRALDAKWGEALVTTNLGYIELHRRNIAQALASMRESLVNWRDLGSVWGISMALAGIAVVVLTYAVQAPLDHHTDHAGLARMWQAVRFFGLVDAVRMESNAPLFRAHRQEIERAIAVARRYLNESAFAEAWSQGQTGSLELAIEEALAIEL
jgi:tetratricopeptide (TPR) repeat protein